MRHFRFNKLIRDKLPLIISQGGIDVIYKNLNGDELLEKLKEKLNEEVKEVVLSNSKEQTIEELADLLEVIQALAKTINIDLQVIEEVRRIKYEKRGGFEEGVFVDKVSMPEDSPMLFFYLDQPDKYPEIKE